MAQIPRNWEMKGWTVIAKHHSATKITKSALQIYGYSVIKARF